MVMMYVLFLLSVIFIRGFAGYDGRKKKGKYIVIKSRILSTLLLDEMVMLEKTYRLKKRQKQNVDCGIDLLSCSACCFNYFNRVCTYSKHPL